MRGATATPIYDGARLLAIEPTRLFVDGKTIGDWRQKGFHKVLPEGVKEDARKSLLVRMLELKRKHPLPNTPRISEEEFDLTLNRDQICTEEDDFDDFADEHPTWGMPFALPGITPKEQASIVDWLEAGTPHVLPPALSAEQQASIRAWEEFLNEPSLKTRLFARYIYEHLFLASLYFADLDQSTFFRLVRSRTPPGQEISEIPTRRPFSGPGKGPLYYRVQRRLGQPLSKTHMPYALSEQRLQRFRELFVTADYQVTELPPYDLKVGANPFKTFRQLPVRSRYRFMLEEAEFTMMGFTKGPVCRGQIALNVIDDRFWISFVNPDAPWLDAEAKFLEKADEYLDMPAGNGSNAGARLWFRLARQQRRFLKAKSAFLEGLAARNVPVELSAIWDGGGDNANAALTVLRHYDSASVVKGFVGGPSKSSWVIGYSLLERIHYLLVAGFDVFGNIGHQLTTRLYMDFLRMEGEYNYLLLLPTERRRQLVDAWYRNVDKDIKDEVYGQVASFSQPSDLVYKTKQPEIELAAMLEAHLDKARSRRFDLSRIEDEGVRSALIRLSKLSGPAVPNFSEISFLAIESKDGTTQHATLLRDSSHTNVAQLLDEDKRRMPEEDRLTVVDGFLGAYPNALYLVAREELEAFVTQAEAMRGEADYFALRGRFGVLRTHPAFWSHSDRLHDAAQKLDPHSGLFDYNRLDPY